MSDCDCCTLIYESEGTKIVQRIGGDGGYELVMPSGNRNIWFTDEDDAIYCASVVGSCWLEAEACGAIEERENGVVAHENKALRSALKELAATASELADHVTTLSGTGVGSYVFDDIASDIKEIADFAASQTLLNEEGEKG